MKIQLNGSQHHLETDTSLLQLIEQQGLANKRLAVEVNQKIIRKADHSGLLLKEGDKVEIVHAIGGG
jgi:sulfur carrier protein